MNESIAKPVIMFGASLAVTAKGFKDLIDGATSLIGFATACLGLVAACFAVIWWHRKLAAQKRQLDLDKDKLR